MARDGWKELFQKLEQVNRAAIPAIRTGEAAHLKSLVQHNLYNYYRIVPAVLKNGRKDLRFRVRPERKN